MKKVIYSVLTMFVFLLTSCSGGYNQSTVKDLMNKVDKGETLTQSDLQTAIDQLNYMVDDLEKADDLDKFTKENEEEIGSMISLGLILAAAEFDGSMPDDLKAESEKVHARIQKLNGSAMPAGQGGNDFGGANDFSEEVEIVEDVE